MKSCNYRKNDLAKIVGKLLGLRMAISSHDAPNRSWEKASSREIQLELGLEAADRLRKR